MITADRRLRDWLMWKVWLPFIFIAVMWPVGVAMHRSDAYQRAFAHGEFLIFGAFVLLEAALEMKHSSPPGEDDFWAEAARVAAIVIVLCYGVVNVLVAQAEEGQPPHKHDLVYYACFSCSVAVVALAVSVFSYWRVKGKNAYQLLP